VILHKQNVKQFIGYFISALEQRAENHDNSKLEGEEAELLAKYTPILANLTYGSEEYKESLKALGPALDHHYKANSHHPESFETGMSGMTLVDLVEMFCDWMAATKRHNDGDIFKSIEVNEERFGISEELAEILRNTARMLKGDEQ